MSQRSTVLFAVGALAITVALSACASSDNSSAGTAEAIDLVGTWTTSETFSSAPEQPYLVLDADNAWRGSDGCNTVTGTWTLADDGTFSATSGPQTMIGCEGAPLPMVISTAVSVAVSGSTATFTDADGTATELVKATDASVGALAEPVGTWTVVDGVTGSFLTLAKDGSYSGNDGCNALTGEWKEADGSIAFTAGATTLMACENSTAWLTQIAKGHIQATTMTVQDATGLVLGQLETK